MAKYLCVNCILLAEKLIELGNHEHPNIKVLVNVRLLIRVFGTLVLEIMPWRVLINRPVIFS